MAGARQGVHAVERKADKSVVCVGVAEKVLREERSASHHSAHAATYIGYASADAGHSAESCVKQTWTYASFYHKRYLRAFAALGGRYRSGQAGGNAGACGTDQRRAGIKISPRTVILGEFLLFRSLHIIMNNDIIGVGEMFICNMKNIMEVLKMDYNEEMVMCPLVDDLISPVDCMENVDTDCKSWPDIYKEKEDFKNICANCKYNGY